MANNLFLLYHVKTYCLACIKMHSLLKNVLEIFNKISFLSQAKMFVKQYFATLQNARASYFQRKPEMFLANNVCPFGHGLLSNTMLRMGNCQG